MESWESTEINDSTTERFSDLAKADLQSKIMTEDLRIQSFAATAQIHSVPIFPKEKKCHKCKKLKDDKRLW